MFIRETTTTKNGKRYQQHKLIESIRTQLGPRQRVILHMGKIKVPKEQWKALANAIEAAYKKQESLIAADPEIQKLAKHYAAQITQNELNERNKKQDIKERETTPEEADKTPKYENIDISTLEHTNAKTIGSEQVIKAQLETYKFTEILTKNGFKQAQAKLAESLLISRAVHPSSERETARWLNNNSGTKEIESIHKKVYDNALHRVAQQLWEQKETIENELRQKAKKQYGLKEKIILYDLTNTFFAGSKKQSHIAKHGRSKEKRNDRPLISIALEVDERGFPKRSEILPGNISEPGTLEKVIEKLREKEPLLPGEKTIVMDAGIATNENLKMIREAGYHYLAVTRQKKYPEEYWKASEEKEIPLTTDKKNPLKVKLTTTDTEAYLLCKSATKKQSGEAILEKRRTRFEEGITELKAGLSKSRCMKQYDRVQQKIGILKERYKVGDLYEIEVTKKTEEASKKTGKEKEVATDIKLTRNEQGKAKEEGLGEYVIRTDRLDLKEEEISQIHRSLTTVEASFRSMKSELGLRPNYHKSDKNIEAHIFITILSYHLLAGIREKLEAAGIHYEWNTVRNILSSHTRVTTSFKTEDGHIMHVRGTSVANLEQVKIYNALEMKHDLLGKQILKIPLSSKKTKKNSPPNVVPKKFGKIDLSGS